MPASRHEIPRFIQEKMDAIGATEIISFTDTAKVEVVNFTTDKGAISVSYSEWRDHFHYNYCSPPVFQGIDYGWGCHLANELSKNTLAREIKYQEAEKKHWPRWIRLSLWAIVLICITIIWLRVI